MEQAIDPKLPLLQDADVEGKVVLLRVDHNVVKKGLIQDPYRIDQTIGTIFNIVERGGRPIIMTHIGRPKDKNGTITVDQSTSVEPIAEYLERKLHTRIFCPRFRPDGDQGIKSIDTSINLAIRDLKEKRLGAIYLPNTRWFQGEESETGQREEFALQLAGLSDVYVNDAFGSWQPHVSTYDITRYLPSFAGYLLQKEIQNLNQVLTPQRPFIAVVAGAKYNTKIGPLNEIYKKVDKLILGGIIYNTYLCAKYGVSIEGIGMDDVEAAKHLVETDKRHHKIMELPFLYESDTIEGKLEGKYRIRSLEEFKAGRKFHYILDIAQESFSDPTISAALDEAKTIFVNAVMGYTPYFTEGSAALDSRIDHNTEANKLYGGGDTLQEFKNLCPGLYLSTLDNSKYYFFTGGGTVLKAIEEGTPYGLAPVKALIENGGKIP
ncbi:MAG: phosphoglycerate kinase [Deltaproteobacteria bacterium]|nr:phosphoglycerate kinase [Deltaproteobacteria bacterium]MBW2076326.1 phosphoglycerate kinase [Deltaproteobacteria bacterium]MBW2311330.1 phosphoglycerate kinase [Deltaproteobacteria bacterium]RLB31643.1 MAG: phosphoglycerate kinase [Deltaproteobacteria bacterium]